jgi:SAM-dependent methyltransferase
MSSETDGRSPTPRRAHVSDEDTIRAPRRSRQGLRIPNELPPLDDDVSEAARSSHIDDAPFAADGARATMPDLASAVYEESTEPGAPPRMSVRPSADVEIDIEATAPITIPPPSMSTASAAAAPVTPPASAVVESTGVMRVVRRNVRLVGSGEIPTTPTPEPLQSSELHVPAPRVPAFDAAVVPPLSEATATVPDDAPPDVAPEAPAPPRMVSEPVPLTVPRASSPTRKPSNPPPARRPSKPPPAEAAPIDEATHSAPPAAPRVTPAAPLPAATHPSSLVPPTEPSIPPAPPLPASMPPLPVSVSAPPAPMAPAAPAVVVAAAAAPEEENDESVDVSLDDGPELSARALDPSLAVLDELAELNADTSTEMLDVEALEHEEPSSRTSSMPPPPPEVARDRPRSAPPPMSKVTGNLTVPDTRPRRRRMWWEDLFNEDYLRMVEPYTAAQVTAETDWIESALGVEAGASILDVGCGPGRQAVGLAKRRYEVTGVDLSLAMLTRAADVAREAEVQVTFTQAEMSAMEYEGRFDAAYCIGSTFGYFDDVRNAEVARRIHRALKPHGTFLLGVLNRDHTIQRQPAMSWFEGDGCVCMEESSFNYITSRLNVKRTMIFDDGRQRELEYSLRLFSLHELGQVLHDAGFRILDVSGHPRTQGAFFGPSSRELIILAQKRGPELVELNTNAEGAGDSARPQG